MRNSPLCLGVLLLGVFMLTTSAGNAQELKLCRFDAVGEACIFDVVADEEGLLIVDTLAGREGDRWRAMIAEVDVEGASGNVGTGSATEFTGAVTRAVMTSSRYEVTVIYEDPLPMFARTNVQVRFTGTGRIFVSDRRPTPFPPVPTRYVGIYRVPISNFDEAFSFEVSADGSYVARILGGHNCGDGRFPFNVPLAPEILPIRANGTFSSREEGIPIAVSTTLHVDGVFFDADGFDGDSEQAVGGLTFIRGVAACPYQWWATADPDADRDGWNNRGEARLSSNPNNRLSIPEHREVPPTPFYGPIHCEDLVDNDLDALIDGDDPGCTAAPETGPIGASWHLRSHEPSRGFMVERAKPLVHAVLRANDGKR